VEWLARQLMEVKVSELMGAEHGERTEDRATQRNGYRRQRWDTHAGEIELQIPKIRQGSYFPSFLQHPGLLRLPADHWRKIRSTNPLEHFIREIGRRTDVVGIFPDDRSLIRLASMLAIEQNEEWLVGQRYLSAASPTRRSSSSNRPKQTPTSPTQCANCCTSWSRRA
jgi:transposase-like protein